VRDRSARAAGLLVAGVLTGVSTAVLSAAAVAGPAGAAATSAQTAQAKKALLVLSDLPAGWTSSPSPSTGAGSFTGAPQLARCLGVPRQIVALLPPEINNAQMSNHGGTVLVQDSISIYPSTKFAEEEYDAVSSRAAPGCLHALLNSTVSSGLAGGSGNGAAATSMSVTKTASPKGTTAFDLDTTLTVQGTSEPIRFELVFFIRGELGDALEFTSYGSSKPPPSLVQHLTALAQSRL
jgi:hypothetical protein